MHPLIRAFLLMTVMAAVLFLGISVFMTKSHAASKYDGEWNVTISK